MNPDVVRFSVVIVHRNGAEMLLQTLAALHAACDPARDEVIVVDNGSTDDSLARVHLTFPAVRILANACNAGFARACNQGLAAGQGEFVLFLNNDAGLPADALDRFAEDFAQLPRAALIGGQLFGPDGCPQRSVGVAPTPLSEMGLVRRRPPDLSSATKPVEVETLVGACMALRRAAAEQAGVLDDAFFFYFEETEWCVRLRRHGWQVFYDPRVRITHLKGASTRPLRRGAQVEMLRSRFTYYRKTLPPAQAYGLAAWRILRLLVNSLSHLLAVALTLGLVRKVRDKLAIYLTLLAWLALGCPRSWGLPDKCPRSAGIPAGSVREPRKPAGMPALQVGSADSENPA